MSAIDFVHDTGFQDLPQDVVWEAVRCFVDTIGVGIAASQTPLSLIIRNHAARMFGGNDAALWVDGRKVSAVGAALANGMTIDALDAHDGHKLTKGHIGCGLIPGLVAIMQSQHDADASECLTCIAIGYEIGTRAGVALHASVDDYHTSGAWIALAVAALGARRLGLDHAQTREAIGIAEYHGPRSQMMRCIDAPTMVKDGSGWGAMAGVSAVYLANDGFTGAPAITMEDEALGEIWGDLGSRWCIREQYIKPYPVCRWAQPAVEATLALIKGNGVDPDQIRSIEIETFHEAARLTSLPTNTEQAQYSLPFAVAAAACRGTIGVAEVTESGLNDEHILNLASRVSIREGQPFNDAFPAQRLARAHMDLTDGRCLQSNITRPKGDPEDRFPDNVVWQKFRDYAGPVLGDAWANDFLLHAQAMPQGGSCAPLFAALAITPQDQPQSRHSFEPRATGTG
ncbi:MAG: MmgE/PrpD family protein [Ahrensia sp.]|nr:MmgE/PrpD family protein [Ahrensia sp.]